jgi:hypothetical protein
MRVNGEMIKQMALGFTRTQTELNIEASGKMTSSTVTVLSHGQTALSTKDSTMRERSTVVAN